MSNRGDGIENLSGCCALLIIYHILYFCASTNHHLLQNFILMSDDAGLLEYCKTYPCPMSPSYVPIF